MTPVRKQLENWFADFTGRIYGRKYTALFSVLLLTAALTFPVKDIKFDTRDESFFHSDDPALLAYNAFREKFGQDDVFIVALQPEAGLTRSFWTTLYDLHTALEAGVPYLDDITSLVNGRVLRANKDTLLVENLLKTPPENDADLKRLLDLIDRYPLYENLLLSADRTVASILIKARAVLETTGEDLLEGFDTDLPRESDSGPAYLSNDQNVEIAATIQKIVAGYRDRGIDIYLSGTPAFVADIQKAIQRDLSIMVPLSLLMIIVLLAILFRRLSGVIYPLMTVMLSLLSCMGIMSLVNIPITNVFQILPTFLLVVAIGDSVHILTIFYRIHRQSGNKQLAIVQAVSIAGLPVLMTSLTTACGLMSFICADVASIAQLGWVASIGVLLAFLYTVVLLPALIAIFPVSPVHPVQRHLHQRTDRLFEWIARVTTRYPIRITLVSVVIVATAAIFASSVRFSHSSLTWFPKNAPIRIATETLNRINGGTVMLEITVDSGSENGLHDPVMLTRLDAAAAAIASINVNGIQAGKVWSVADMLKEINRALHEDKDHAYALPQSRALIAQELILFEASGSDDLEDFADSTYRIGRLSVLAPFTDAVLYKDYLDQVKTSLYQYFQDDTVILTGHLSLFIQLIRNFITSMVKSYSIALVVITILMVLLIGRIRVGLMSMVANVVPIVGIFGVMGALSIPLDMATILIGSIVLGMVVDDTIHYLHHFRRAYDETGSVEAAVLETLTTTGRALFVTSMVLCGGFVIYTSSYLASNIRFGLLSGCAVLFALAADFFLVPALLSIVYGRQSEFRKSDLRQTL